MQLQFTKMQGLGNDYIYINDSDEQLRNLDELARQLSCRHFGVGSDGLIVVKPSHRADFFMEMYNADGSQGKMCGNGIRCFCKYIYDQGLTQQKRLMIETLSGIKEVQLLFEDDIVIGAVVDMGKPIFDLKDIPIDDSKGEWLQHAFQVDDKMYEVSAVSMGNPHLVVYEDEIDNLNLQSLGPLFEKHEQFPEGINTEFIEVISEHTIKMRVWERGSGETLACGTGACAAAVVSKVLQKVQMPVTVQLRGGELRVDWNEDTQHVMMTGAAVTVFSGEIALSSQFIK